MARTRADGAAASAAAKANPALAAAKLEKNDAKREGRKASGTYSLSFRWRARGPAPRLRAEARRVRRAGSVKSFA